MAITLNGTTGITTPAIDNQGNLTVDGGTIKLDGNYPVGTGNVALGNTALDSNVSGEYNTAIGDVSLTSNTTGLSNVSVGAYSMENNVGGNYNTSVGVLGLRANTSGANNTGLGYAALLNNTTASNNTAVGYQAGYSTTTGAINVAIGHQALFTNTTGLQSTAIGGSASYSNTTGSFNAALGQATLYNNTTGSYNTALGIYALNSNSTASNNTAVGYQAGWSNTTASELAAIGFTAGANITTGQGNTVLGSRAGNYGISLTTGVYNVIVGSYSHTSDAGSNNAIVIGHNVSGDSDYTTLGNAAADIRALHGTATWATVSDERYKKDIVDSEAGLSLINALRPRTFKYRTLGELPETFRAYEANSTKVFKNSNTNHGFIAQEVKAAIDADSSIKDGFKLWDDRDDGSQEVAEAALIPILVKALQELSAKNDALTARITALEGN
jgi:trimeric autotransporter adhesin